MEKQVAVLLEIAKVARDYFELLERQGIVLPQARPNVFSDAEPTAIKSRLDVAIVKLEGWYVNKN